MGGDAWFTTRSNQNLSVLLQLMARSRGCTIRGAKTAQVISAFVFAKAKLRFYHDATQLYFTDLKWFDIVWFPGDHQ